MPQKIFSKDPVLMMQSIHIDESIKKIIGQVYFSGDPEIRAEDLYFKVSMELCDSQKYCPSPFVFKQVFEEYYFRRFEHRMDVLKRTYFVLKQGHIKHGLLENDIRIPASDIIVRKKSPIKKTLIGNDCFRLKGVEMFGGDLVGIDDILGIASDNPFDAAVYVKRKMHKTTPKKIVCKTDYIMPCYTCAVKLKYPSVANNLRILADDPGAASKLILAARHEEYLLESIQSRDSATREKYSERLVILYESIQRIRRDRLEVFVRTNNISVPLCMYLG